MHIHTMLAAAHLGIEGLRDGRDDPRHHCNSRGVFKSKPLPGTENHRKTQTETVTHCWKTLKTVQSASKFFGIFGVSKSALRLLGNACSLNTTVSCRPPKRTNQGFLHVLQALQSTSPLRRKSLTSPGVVNCPDIEVKILTDTPGHVYVGDDRGRKPSTPSTWESCLAVSEVYVQYEFVIRTIKYHHSLYLFIKPKGNNITVYNSALFLPAARKDDNVSMNNLIDDEYRATIEIYWMNNESYHTWVNSRSINTSTLRSISWLSKYHSFNT